jgi:hypothetical protein
MDANQCVEAQQAIVRELVTQRVRLADYRRAEKPSSKPSSASPKKSREEVPAL